MSAAPVCSTAQLTPAGDRILLGEVPRARKAKTLLEYDGVKSELVTHASARPEASAASGKASIEKEDGGRKNGQHYFLPSRLNQTLLVLRPLD